MALIEKRVAKDGAASFRVRVRLKGYPEQHATFERKTDAQKWAQQTEAAIREGRHFRTSEAKRRTLGELIDRYMRDILPTKPRTAPFQKRQLEWWKARLGEKVLADVSAPGISEAKADLERGMLADGAMTQKITDASGKVHTRPVEPRSPATVKRYLAALSHAFTIAVKEWHWLEQNPVNNVSKPKEPRGRVRYLSDDERERLLAACRRSSNPDLYTAVILAISTGARRMEIMSLRWKQVDLNRGVITLSQTKNGEIRALPLTAKALELMKERAKVRRLDSDLVFPASRAPRKPLHPEQAKQAKPVDLRKPFEKALQEAGIVDFVFHDLRHTCASYLAMNGASLAEIAEVLGHKTLQMVKRYAHLSQAHVARVVERMNERVFG
jgi:integrase